VTPEATPPERDLTERLAREAPAVHAAAYGVLFDRDEATEVTRAVLESARRPPDSDGAPADAVGPSLDRAATQLAFARRSFLTASTAPAPDALGAVRTALDSLPTDHRTALLQHVMANLSAGAIAERHGLAPAAVRAALFRAWRSLERRLTTTGPATAGARPKGTPPIGGVTCRRAESLLWLAATGELAEASEGRLNAHLDGCSACRGRLGRIEALVASVRSTLIPLGLTDREAIELAHSHPEAERAAPEAPQAAAASWPRPAHLGRHATVFLSALLAAAALCGALWPRPVWGPVSNGLRAGLDTPARLNGSGPLRLRIRLRNVGRRPLRVALAEASWNVTLTGPDGSTFLMPLQATEDPVRLEPGQALAKLARRDYVLSDEMRVDLHALPSGRYCLRGRYIHLSEGAVSPDLWTGRLETNTVEIRITRP